MSVKQLMLIALIFKEHVVLVFIILPPPLSLVISDIGDKLINKTIVNAFITLTLFLFTPFRQSF